MKTEDLQAEITAIDQASAQLKSGVELDIVKKLLNLVEKLMTENAEQKTELQKLRDEINRLKGEQGKPDIKANKKKDGDISSEYELKPKPMQTAKQSRIPMTKRNASENPNYRR